MNPTSTTTRHGPRRRLRLSLAVGIGTAAAIGATSTAAAIGATSTAAAGRDGHVYAISNDPAGNSLLVFDRAGDGALTAAAPVPTGGTGTGSGIGSQGAVAVADGGRVVVAVDPGSDEVSLFVIVRGRLVLADTEPSGGDLPTSVTVHGRDVYVLNAGVANNVSGLHIGRAGLEPIVGSTQALSEEAAGGAQVAFTPDGRQLVVTEKNTNSIDTFRVRDGVAGPAAVFESNGTTPFGFDFGRNGELLVSNASGGAPGASSVSSYAIRRDGSLVVLDGPDATNQTSACWLVATGRYAYTANTGSASLSGYSVDRRGALDLLAPDGVSAAAGTTPIDIDASSDGRYVYQLNGGDDSIGMFAVGRDGELTNLGFVTGLPAAAVGLTAS
ncbi:MAG: 3-carboxymuconate cyclase [Ilumatobacteraceae bacterium]